MKTLLSIIFVLLVTVAAIAFDAYRLNFADWLTAAIVAAMFGSALNDSRRPARLGHRPVDV